jgi:hypothetical protein
MRERKVGALALGTIRQELQAWLVEHQARALWAERIRQGQDAEQAVEALLHAMRYDRSLRHVAVESTHLNPGLLEFLSGRPLSITIRMYGVKLSKNGERVTIVPAV